MAARRMASSVYEAHVLEPEDLPKMGCSEGAGDKGHEEAHVATSIHYELHRILQFASKSDEEPCGIAFNLPRVRRPNHVFDIQLSDGTNVASKECATGAFVNAFRFEHERADTDSRNIGCRVCRVNVHERQVVAHTVLRSGISGKT
jgi:hypothetical protein